MTLQEFLSEWNNDADRVLVHTSGSTGKPKPLWVEKRRMEASARITCRFLGLRAGDTALLCMPLDYIAGKMMVVRALTCGLRLLSVEPSSHPMRTVSASVDFAAMVPLQVIHTLQVAEERERLMQVRHLIIGGGAIDDDMAAELRTFPHAVWSTYGMTETLSHIAMRRLSGKDASEWYTPMPGVSLSQDPDGCLIINAHALNPETLITNDIVVLRQDGTFRIIGRRDNVICSGGVKLQIEKIENELQPLLSSPFMITKKKDIKFGEIVVLLTEGDTERAKAELSEMNNKFSKPKLIIHIDKLPLTETGKPARARAMALASSLVY